MKAVRTLEEIRHERGEGVHGFVLMVTGSLPADPNVAKRVCESIRDQIDEYFSGLERIWNGDIEITGLQLRMERSEVYIKEGLPNAS